MKTEPPTGNDSWLCNKRRRDREIEKRLDTSRDFTEWGSINCINFDWHCINGSTLSLRTGILYLNSQVFYTTKLWRLLWAKLFCIFFTVNKRLTIKIRATTDQFNSKYTLDRFQIFQKEIQTNWINLAVECRNILNWTEYLQKFKGDFWPCDVLVPFKYFLNSFLLILIIISFVRKFFGYLLSQSRHLGTLKLDSSNFLSKKSLVPTWLAIYFSSWPYATREITVVKGYLITYLHLSFRRLKEVRRRQRRGWGNFRTTQNCCLRQKADLWVTGAFYPHAHPNFSVPA